ncbi:hypothetical protein HF086_011116 [Spodoptera exigua]|uniref:Fatty acyl-CoA reductase n=1 Tax=Spodoptera exigua TaxID=7107 RepID=A0A922MZP0_SPOEX|nr:hypothetical protein HF086_011116 [Spodoptera exigua]
MASCLSGGHYVPGSKEYVPVAEFYADKSVFVTGGTGFMGKLFETLRRERPQELNKIVPIVGDITEPELGISAADQTMLCQKALVHVSTAYCNCERERVEETVYAPPAHPEHVVTLVQTLPDDLVDRITPDLVGK